MGAPSHRGRAHERVVFPTCMLSFARGGGNTCLFQFVHVTSISRKKVLKSVYENLKFVGWFSKSSICSKLGKIKNNIAFSVFILQYATTQTNNKSCFKSFYAD